MSHHGYAVALDGKAGITLKLDVDIDNATAFYTSLGHTVEVFSMTQEQYGKAHFLQGFGKLTAQRLRSIKLEG